MTQEIEKMKHHPNWLRFMYVYTIFGAGGIGLGLLVIPSTMMSLLGIPTEEPIVAGVVYSAWLAFGILSILGLRSPLKFAPVLLLQLTYKVVWFAAVIAPKAVSGNLPSFAITMSAIFASFVIGDIVAIPWKYIIAKSN
ncbi:MAG TPA: hypothetical protein VMD05_09255 [Candidatus Nanoarchaeia archaeon]|nr:hypothetical protein [Candidatus Nanoarchaeia archaeon]